MSVTILEVLQNAETNINAGQELKILHYSGKRQLHNAIVLLKKGYNVNDTFDHVIDGYESAEDVPEVKDVPEKAEVNTDTIMQIIKDRISFALERQKEASELEIIAFWNGQLRCAQALLNRINEATKGDD